MNDTWELAAAIAAIFIPLLFYALTKITPGIRFLGARQAAAPGVVLLLACLTIGLTAFLFAMLWGWLIERMPTFVAFVVIMLISAFTVLPIRVICGVFVIEANRYLVPDGVQLLQSDDRPPIVYLRSFKDDEHQATVPELGGAMNGTLEERLMRRLQSHGPVIALDAPEADLPSLGAARIKGSENWKNEVIEIVSQASLVVIRPSLTAAVKWETATALELVGAERIALYVYELEESTWQDYREWADMKFGAELPARFWGSEVLYYFRSSTVKTICWFAPPFNPIVGLMPYQVTAKMVKPLFEP